MTRTVLITGATGSVSGALLQALQAPTGLKLRALVRDQNKAGALRARGVEVVSGDLDEPESLPRAFEGVQDLWLLNAVGPRQPENSMNAVWAAKRAGVERVVRLSAIGAAHDAPSRNGRLHALSDAELMSSGLKWTILRPHFFTQNLLMTAQTVASQGAFYWDMGNGRLGMVDVRDIGEVAAKDLAQRAGRAPRQDLHADGTCLHFPHGGGRANERRFRQARTLRPGAARRGSSEHAGNGSI